MKLATTVFCILTASCNPSGPMSPLISATRDGDTARMLELIKSGADVNERGGVNNWTPLMHAVHKNQPAAVQILIDANADVNLTAGLRNRDTALRLAEAQNEPAIIKILVTHGAKPTP